MRVPPKNEHAPRRAVILRSTIVAKTSPIKTPCRRRRRLGPSARPSDCVGADVQPTGEGTAAAARAAGALKQRGLRTGQPAVWRRGRAGRSMGSGTRDRAARGRTRRYDLTADGASVVCLRRMP